MAVTRIKNNQITGATIVASSKVQSGTITGGLLSSGFTYTGDFTITGNLIVNGTTTTVDATNTLIADPVIMLSRGTSGVPANDSGFVVKRGTSDNAAWLWDEANDQFVGITTTSDGSGTGAITPVTYAGLKVGALNAASFATGNINIATNTLTATNTNGNIVLTPIGTGNVIISTATASRVFYSGASKEALTSSNFTFDGTNAVIGGTLGVNGASLTSSSTTFALVNATVTTLNIGGAATTLNLGASSGTTTVNNNLTTTGDLAVNGGDITSTSTSFTLANATVTTLNIGGAATTLNLGAATGTSTVRNNLSVTGDIAVNGGDITSGTTTLNIGNTVTSLNLGAATGTTSVLNTLQVVGNQIKSSTGNVAITLSNKDITIAGNLTIQGSTTAIGTSDLTVQDSIVNLHTDVNLTPLTVDDGRDLGLRFHYFKGAYGTAFVGWSNANQSLDFYSSATDTASVISGTFGKFRGLQFVSTATTGTAPFVVSSTTQVANLNAATAGTAATVTTAAQPSITSLGTLTILNVDNLQLDANTISSTNTNGNINLTPNGTGEVVLSTLAVSDLTSGRVPYLTTSGSFIDSANMTFNGSTLAVTGTISTTGTLSVSGTFNANNLRITGNDILSTNTNGNVTVNPNGTGYIVLNSNAASTDLIINGNTTVSASYANLVYVKSSTGQIGFRTNSPATGASIDMGAITDSVIIPKGTTGTRPGTPTEGMFRHNTSLHTPEYWNGTAWALVSGNFTLISSNTFTGDGTTTAYTLSAATTSASTIVSINGIVQMPGVAYGVSSTTLTFTEAPAVGDDIDIRILTTTATVTGVSDSTTEIVTNDSTQTITNKIHGTTVMTVGNTAVIPGLDNTYNLGSSSFKWATIYGTSTSAQYADLAEYYLSDAQYAPGTVVMFGGSNEITIANSEMSKKIAGVVSTNPAHVMNSELQGEFVVALALTGRVPCKVKGNVAKGDMMVSTLDGYARAEENPALGSVIGKALEDFNGDEGVIEVVVGRL